MSYISSSACRLRPQAVILTLLISVLGMAPDVTATLYDLNVLNGNYNVATNWIDHTTSTSAIPSDSADAAMVRNGGILNVTAADGNAGALLYRIGAGPQTNTNAPEGYDPPAPPTYGGAGTLNWTGSDVLSGVVGLRMNVGEHDNTNNIEYTGIVNQSGGKTSLNTVLSFLVIGATGTTPTPTSVYNLSGGTIGVTAATGGNNGINIRNGTLNMTGGQIISDDATTSGAQRAITLGTTSGPTGSENTAYANFSGGSVKTYGGLRLGDKANTKSYVTISGTADLHFRATDMQVASNATDCYAQVDMSGGSLKVGDATLTPIQDRRLIVGDSGTGVFNLSGGTVNINHSFVVGNNATSNGLFYQTGGTFTVRDIETNRNSGVWDLTTENAAIIIDGPNAVFNQQNTSPTLTGEMTLGRVGKGRFEIRQGQANIREIDISDTAQSRATLNVFGGKLKIQDGVFRNNIANDATNNNTPTINLTGGKLELAPVAPTPDAMSWQASMLLKGTAFDPKPGAVMLTNVGSSPNRPADFSLNTGSTWDLDIASNTLYGGADWVDVPNPTLAAAINGGQLNIHQIGGYTPAVGDEVTIVRNASLGVTLNLASLTVSDPHWQPLLAAGNTELHLKYVAIAALPGDYNNNGTVDAADYALWRKNPSAFGGTPAGYNTWRTNFGRPPGSGNSLVGAGSAVPEPTTIVLIGLVALMSLGTRPARFRKL